jgi:hypothetical protein
MNRAFVLLVFLMSCTLEDSTDGIDINNVMQFDPDQVVNVSADGVSPLTIKVTLGKNVSNDQTITFKTDQGKFQTATDAAGKELKVTTTLKEASVILIPDTKAGVVGLSASVTSGTQVFTISKQINFDNAIPSFLYLTTDKQVVVPDKAALANLKITAARDPGKGKVSDDTMVSIISEVTKGTVQIDVIPFVKLVGETATFTVRSLNEEEGTVKITATIANGDKPIVAQRTIEFKK